VLSWQLLPAAGITPLHGSHVEVLSTVRSFISLPHLCCCHPTPVCTLVAPPALPCPPAARKQGDETPEVFRAVQEQIADALIGAAAALLSPGAIDQLGYEGQHDEFGQTLCETMATLGSSHLAAISNPGGQAAEGGGKYGNAGRGWDGVGAARLLCVGLGAYRDAWLLPLDPLQLLPAAALMGMPSPPLALQTRKWPSCSTCCALHGTPTCCWLTRHYPCGLSCCKMQPPQ